MRATFVYAAYENLGIEYLSAVARRAGHETSLVFDPCLFDDQFTSAPFAARLFDFEERTIEGVVAARPDLVCFSLVTDKYPWFVKRARRIRERLPDVPIVAGGIHVTSVPEAVLANDFCDYVVTGEGEGAFVELLDVLAAGGDVAPILNLGYKRDGRMILNEKRKLIDPLDTLPFADKELYDGTSVDHAHMYTIMASRGCPLKCTFCNNNIYHREYQHQSWSRTRSLDSVFAELHQAVARYRPQTFNFLDEIFGLSDKWLGEFCERYRREIAVPFIACLYPGFLAEHRVKQLAEAGCVKVDVGVQSVNEQMRREIMKRNDTNEHIANGIRALKRHGIAVAAENIVATPGEREEHLVEMARFYNDLRPDVMKFFWLKYYPKTEMVDVAFERGAIDRDHRDAFHRGEDRNSLSTGGSMPTHTAQKFYTLFVLLPFLSPRTVHWLLERRYYRFLPTMWFPRFSYLILRFLNRKGGKAEVLMERYKRHYRRYVRERVVAAVLPRRPVVPPPAVLAPAPS